jgi:hypothetical protein
LAKTQNLSFFVELRRRLQARIDEEMRGMPASEKMRLHVAGMICGLETAIMMADDLWTEYGGGDNPPAEGE